MVMAFVMNRTIFSNASFNNRKIMDDLFTLLFSFYQWDVQIAIYEQHSTHSFDHWDDQLQQMPILTIYPSMVCSIFILLYLSRFIAVWVRMMNLLMSFVFYIDLFIKGRTAISFLWKMCYGIYDPNIANAA